jgi:hypothetical protein
MVSASVSQAVGTVTVTVTSLPGQQLTKYTVDWVSDGSGNVSANPIDVVHGVIQQIHFVPDAGGTQPDASYDVTLTYNGADLLIAAGANLSNSVATFSRPTPQPIHDGAYQLDLVVSGAGASNGGTVIFWVGAQ